ncbi:hypothetical protein TruAng_004933 [Truncatella angustata]|nr:hypothetical protein TruAng_004933 [Truncatella angustata]
MAPLTNLRVRKVKCDEAKPSCFRCTSTGRKCDGYPTARLPGLTWYRPNHLFQSVDQPEEGRALEFFCHTAGLLLSGPLDAYFWTHLVLQFSNFEPAVRHSLVAISSLYEDFHCKGKSAQQLQTNTFALIHYNAAIENLRKLDSEPLILLVCVLFVCIEVIQNNREAAMQHSRHGIVILERIGTSYPWTVEYLSPIFRRLSLFPLFFGNSANTFPALSDLHDPIPVMFISFAEAQYHMDAITCRAARLVRQGDVFRIGKLHREPVDPDLLKMQKDLQRTINSWHDSFKILAARIDLSDKDNAYCNLMLRYKISRLWATTTFEKNETFHDDHIDDLAEIFDRAEEQSPPESNCETASLRPCFTFEIGFVPFVICAVMKIRDLRTRLRGLRVLRSYGPKRENMWEAERFYPICKRLVEIEHDIVLDENDQPVGDVNWDARPTEEQRCKDFGSLPNKVRQKDANGNEVWGSYAGYIMRTVEGKIWLRQEFIRRPAPLVDEQGSYSEK